MMPMMPYCAPTTQQPLQPIQFNGQQNGRNNRNNGNGNNNNGNGNNRSNAKHPIKRYENQNYCHSCGFDIASTHTSQTCPKPKQNHQYNATRSNIMGGSMTGSHKTIMPSAAGRVCQEAKRQQQHNNGYQQQQNG